MTIRIKPRTRKTSLIESNTTRQTSTFHQMVILRNFLRSACGFNFGQKTFNQIQSKFMDICLSEAAMGILCHLSKRRESIIISLHKLVALLDEEDALDRDSGICIRHIVV